jgi:lysophospholipase L1-like esterase
VVLFVGDSFIQGMCVSAIVDKAVNLGIGGDTTVGLLKRLPTYASIPSARAIVLAVGGNDLRERDNVQIVENYRQILSVIPENVAVLFCSVLLRDERCRPERFNSRIAELNRFAAEICSSMANCHFVDLAERLKDTDGNLSHNCHEGDGIHLNCHGYRICNEMLSTWIARVLGQETR